MNRLISAFINKGVFADLLTIGVIIAGIVSLSTLRRETFPNVSFDIITITTVYPGASPKEVERLVTNKIEQEMNEVDGIKKLTSISAEGRSLILAQLDPDQTTDQEAEDDIQDVVDRIKNELPEDSQEPIVTLAESKKQPIIEVSIAGEFTDLELREEAKALERKLEELDGVARVVINGLRDLEIHVEADQRKLNQYDISIENMAAALQAKNRSTPGSAVEILSQSGKVTEEIVRAVSHFDSVKDVEDTVIRANDLGQGIRVRDVAKVHYGLEDATNLNRTNSIRALGLTVLKKESADAVTMVDQVKEVMESLKPTLKKGLHVEYINDMSYFIRRRLQVLSGNLAVGLCLVLIVLTLLLPIRVSLIVGAGIPFAFLGTLLIFAYLDIGISLLSMMGLIIVVGMLVDDAVVVTDNCYRHIEEGKDPKTAAIEGTQQIWVAITASVMTTVMAFFPLTIMTGIIGKFVKYIPYAVIIALFVSLFECYFILPHHVAAWAKSKEESYKGFIGKIQQAINQKWNEKLVPFYISVLKKFVRFRYLVLVGVLMILGATIYLMTGPVKFILFPPSGIETFFVRVETGKGTKLQKTGEIIRPIEDAVSKLPKSEVKNYVSRIGVHANDANDPNAKRGSEYAQVVVYLTAETDRDRRARDIIEQLRGQIGQPEGVKEIKFQMAQGGPPVGKPISVGVRGSEYEDILPAVEDLKKLISPLDGVSDVQDNFFLGKEEIHVVVDPIEAAAAGLNEAAIGRSVRAAFEGLEATEITQLEEEVVVRVSLPRDRVWRQSEVESLLIPTPSGKLLPLNRVAKIKRDQGLASYEHEANQRQVRVEGEIDTDITTSSEVNAFVESKIPELRKKHPKVAFNFGGEGEDTKESMQSLMRAMMAAGFSIFLILVLTFGNVLQPMLILITIPLGLISVVWSFFLHQQPLTFLAFMGIVALAGVIVNNAIVLISFINDLRDKGSGQMDSIFEASKIRLRPIFLTTITTALGILPTAYGIGGLDPFVVPIALALGWGVLIGSGLTSFVFPTAVAILDDIVNGFKRAPKASETSR